MGFFEDFLAKRARTFKFIKAYDELKDGISDTTLSEVGKLAQVIHEFRKDTSEVMYDTAALKSRMTELEIRVGILENLLKP